MLILSRLRVSFDCDFVSIDWLALHLLRFRCDPPWRQNSTTTQHMNTTTWRSVPNAKHVEVEYTRTTENIDCRSRAPEMMKESDTAINKSQVTKVVLCSYPKGTMPVSSKIAEPTQTAWRQEYISCAWHIKHIKYSHNTQYALPCEITKKTYIDKNQIMGKVKSIFRITRQENIIQNRKIRTDED